MHRLILLLFSCVAFAQLATNTQPTVFSYSFNTGVIAIQTSPTQITVPRTPGTTTPFVGAVYVCYVEVNANGQAITLNDGNGKPYMFNAAVIGSGGTPTGALVQSSYDGVCRLMPNGIFLSANSTGATAILVIKHN